MQDKEYLKDEKDNIKALKQEIIWEVEGGMNILIHDFNFSTFKKDDIRKTFKSLKRKIKLQFKEHGYRKQYYNKGGK
tara:strand:+ start:332 stop:562 length:231 start_codon:yes stop_codon:yes gene_type:complete